MSDQPEIDKFGTKKWRQNGCCHRLDGPAVIYENGDQEWYQNDRRHRTDGPAVIRADGSRFWYQNGLLHRLDGPAIIWPNGSLRWWIDDRRYSLNEYLEKNNKLTQEQKVMMLLKYG